MAQGILKGLLAAFLLLKLQRLSFIYQSVVNNLCVSILALLKCKEIDRVYDQQWKEVSEKYYFEFLNNYKKTRKKFF